MKSLLSKRERYRRLKGHAQERLDQIAAQIAQLQQQLTQLEQQLEDLSQYNLQVDQLAGMLSAQQVMQRKAFVQQLLQARAHQQQQCQQLNEQIAQLQQAWQQQYREVKALEKLLERTEQALARAEAKRAQKEMDAFAARKPHH